MQLLMLAAMYAHASTVNLLLEVGILRYTPPTVRVYSLVVNVLFMIVAKCPYQIVLSLVCTVPMSVFHL